MVYYRNRLKKITKQFFEWIYPKRPARIEWLLLKQSLNKTLPFAKGILLDVGSHDKPFFGLFSQAVSSFIACDLYDPRAKDRNVDFYADGRYLPIKNESINTILCTGVLHLVPEPKEMLFEFKRVLVDGGYVICTTPFNWRRQDVRSDAGYWDYYRFTERGLEYLAKSVGFDVVYIEARGGIWSVIGEMISMNLYSTFGRGKMGRLIMKFIILPLQTFAYCIDNIVKNTGETLGYTAVFKKPEVN